MKEFVRRHETTAFVALTFGLGWAMWTLSGILRRADLRAPDWRWALAQVGVFAPAFAGMLVATCVEPGAGRRALRTLLLVYLPATALAFALAWQDHASLVEIGAGWTAVIAALGVWVLLWFGRGVNRIVAWPGEEASPGTVALWTLGALVRRPVGSFGRTALAVLAVLVGAPFAFAQGSSAGLPLLDLAGETGRQVVVDREAGQYLGHPTTVLLEDGKTILCVYPKGHGKGAIVYKRSEDGGKTWSGRLPTPASWATSLETPTIYRTVDRGGKKRLLLFSGLYPIRLSVSEDDGASWSELRPIGPYGGIVAMASLVRLRDGSHLAMFHDDGRFFREGGSADGVFRLYQVRSEDGGLSWGDPRLVFRSGEVHLCEPGLVWSPDGKTLAALLRENRRLKNAHVIFSGDEGATWSAPRALPATLTGDRHVLRYAPDGRLFATFRDMAAGSPTRGDWTGWVGRWEDLVEGGRGQYRVRLMKNHEGTDCAYPGLERLPDGTFVATTYGHWTPGEPPYVVSVRFTLPELDAMAKTSSP